MVDARGGQISVGKGVSEQGFTRRAPCGLRSHRFAGLANRVRPSSSGVTQGHLVGNSARGAHRVFGNHEVCVLPAVAPAVALVSATSTNHQRLPSRTEDLVALARVPEPALRAAASGAGAGQRSIRMIRHDGRHVVVSHFSLANPVDDRPDDLPHLLRRIADAIEQRGIGPMDILDLTISKEITGDGPWWSVTLYWSDK